MDDSFEFLGCKQFRYRVAVSEIQVDEPKRWLLRQNIEARVLQRDVIVLVQIVQTDDFIAAFQQRSGGMETDKPSSTGNQSLQVNLTIRVAS